MNPSRRIGCQKSWVTILGDWPGGRWIDADCVLN